MYVTVNSSAFFQTAYNVFETVFPCTQLRFIDSPPVYFAFLAVALSAHPKKSKPSRDGFPVLTVKFAVSFATFVVVEDGKLVTLSPLAT